ncbi:unnamed protein product [Ambrosiozyma monospora]|uniref:triacylglycerol lipase n=1 Tax=Ambrosiozyma monospora TaxID=43982 RepID=A0A9W6WLF4_AMBMO|nr:unnamed protein product [Ambrosiozyma monospora]
MNVKKFGCVKPQAHRGFKKGYASFHNTDAPQFIIDFMNEHSSYRLIICGHSLGGAMAQFAGLEFYLAGLSPTIFTYGAPKAFNKNLAHWIDSEFSSNFVGGIVSNRAVMYRVVTSRDHVPLLPLYYQGFSHIGTEICIKVAGSKIKAYSIHGSFKTSREDRSMKNRLKEFLSHRNPKQGIHALLDTKSHKHYPIHMTCKK